MPEKLKTALVGVGKVTNLHAAALVNLPESEFTAVCGRSREKTENYAARFGKLLQCLPLQPNHVWPNVEDLEAGVVKQGIKGGAHPGGGPPLLFTRM